MTVPGSSGQDECQHVVTGFEPIADFRREGANQANAEAADGRRFERLCGWRRAKLQRVEGSAVIAQRDVDLRGLELEAQRDLVRVVSATMQDDIGGRLVETQLAIVLDRLAQAGTTRPLPPACRHAPELTHLTGKRQFLDVLQMSAERSRDGLHAGNRLVEAVTDGNHLVDPRRGQHLGDIRSGVQEHQVAFSKAVAFCVPHERRNAE